MEKINFTREKGRATKKLKFIYNNNYRNIPQSYRQTYAQIFILQICLVGRLMAMPKFLYCKYVIWADLWSNFYTSNMPYGQTYAQFFILQICLLGRLRAMHKYIILQISHMGRLMSKFLYFKYAIWADLCPIFNKDRVFFSYPLKGCLFFLYFGENYMSLCWGKQ